MKINIDKKTAEMMASYKTASGNLAFHLWLAHGSQSGLKALQWKIETLFIAKTADLLTTAVFYRPCKNENALCARLAGFWQMICLL